jgi:tetratricopeptide (TPR) repeat protein
MGHYREAAPYFSSLVASLEGDDLRDRFGMLALPAVQARSFLAECLAALGAFAEAITYAEDAVRIAEAVGHPYNLIDAYLRVGHLYRHKGDVDKSIPAYEYSRALGQEANMPLLHVNTTSGLGSAYVLSGRVAEAIPLLEQAVAHAVSMRFLVLHAQRLMALSGAYVLAGRMDEARQQAQQALELSCKHQESGDQARALRLLGEIASGCNPPEVAQAEAYYRQAMVLAEEREMRPLLAHCHSGLGALYVKKGWREQARAELATAIDLYRAMEMTFWLPPGGGRAGAGRGLIMHSDALPRPCRAPRHTIADVGLIGGGQVPMPGERKDTSHLSVQLRDRSTLPIRALEWYA